MIDKEEYLKTRAEDQINWYDKKSVWNQKQYKRLRITSITISVIIPILTLLLNNNKTNNNAIAILISVASAAVVLIQGIISLYKFQDNWTNYRTTSESLKFHKFLFETQTAPYDGPDAFSQFVQNVENVLTTERVRWVKGSQPDPASKPDTGASADLAGKDTKPE